MGEQKVKANEIEDSKPLHIAAAHYITKHTPNTGSRQRKPVNHSSRLSLYARLTHFWCTQHYAKKKSEAPLARNLQKKNRPDGKRITHSKTSKRPTANRTPK